MTSIVSTDILFKLSAPSASSGNSQAGNPGLSWGGYVSTTVVSSTPLDNVFQDITGAENAASQVDYSCIFIHNNTLSGNAMQGVIAWLPSSNYINGGASVAIALDPTGATALGSSTQQAVRISSGVVAPVGVTGWIGPTGTSSGGLSLGTIAPGYVYPLWIQRTAANTSAVNNDGARIQLAFSSNG